MTTKKNTSKTTANVPAKKISKTAVVAIGPRKAQAAKNAKTVIVVLKKDNPYRGQRAKMFAVIKPKMTVAQYLETLRAKGLPVERWTLDKDVKNGLISLKAA